MRDRILKIIIVVLTFFLVCLLWLDHTEEQKRQEYYEQMERAERPLRLEKEKLQEQLADLKKNSQEKWTGTASLELLFTEASDEFMGEIEPLMTGWKMTGVLALSLEQLAGQSMMPGDDTLEKLLEKGWSWCLYYEENQNQDMAEWLAEAAPLWIEHNLPEPEAVYFKAGTYSMDYDIPLYEAGISILVHHGEEALPLITNADAEAEELWKPGACGWNGDGARTRLKHVISQGMNLAFTVGGNTPGEVFERRQFQSMLAAIWKYEQQGDLVLTGLEQARVLQIEQSDTDGQTVTDYKKQKEELEEQIEKLKQQMDDIYIGGQQ